MKCIFHSRPHKGVKNLAPGPCPYLQEPEVDLIHDGQVAGQDALQQGGGPSLQGLGEHGVVGVSTGIHGDVPRLKKHNTHRHHVDLMLIMSCSCHN